MFSFSEDETDFFLPQLVNMYIQMPDVAEVLHPYLVHRSVVVIASTRPWLKGIALKSRFHWRFISIL